MWREVKKIDINDGSWQFAEMLRRSKDYIYCTVCPSKEMQFLSIPNFDKFNALKFVKVWLTSFKDYIILLKLSKLGFFG